MADSLVIVAVPDENDRVWKVSSEKVPHLTLLYLGEDVSQVDNVDSIVQFVEHAANTMLRRFYLPVDRRGELGEDKADVVFFKKNRYDARAIREFRNALLGDSNIRTAYDSASQFDGPWLPHLTLGYPTSPAKKDPDDQPLWDVSFNRVAVWMGNYEGPEFMLKDHWDEIDDVLERVPMDVAMSDIKGGAGVLAHISEEPWGNFKESDYTPEQWHKACLVHLHDGEPTSKSECKLPVRTPDGTLNRNGVHAAAAAMAGARGGLKGLSDDQEKKAKTALVRCYSQLDEDPPDSLAHYGVKGMKWGQRKARDTVVTVNGQTTMVTAKKAAKLDNKWEKNQYTLPKGIERHNFMADHINSRLGTLNDKYKDADLVNDEPTKKKYTDEYNALLKDAFHKAVKEVHGTNPTGTREAVAEQRGDELQLVIKDVKKVQHAAIEDGDEVFLFRITRNAQGLIVKTERVEDTMAQTADLGAEFLEHYGVKGMKWGVRKEAKGQSKFDFDRHGRNRWDPKDHTLGDDIAKSFVLPAPFSLPANVRIARRAGRSAADAATKAGPGLKRFGAGLADSAWQNSTYSSAKHERIHNTVAKDVDNHVERLQRSPKYANKNLKTDSDLRKSYYEDVAKVTDAAYRRGIKDEYGDNFTSTKSAHYVNDARGPRIEVRDKKTNEFVSEAPLKSLREIQRERDTAALDRTLDPNRERVRHAADDEAPDLDIALKIDANGFIKGVGFVVPSDDPEAAIAQSTDLGASLVGALLSDDEVALEHYGVKGMKWGVRKDLGAGPRTPVDPVATSVRRGEKGYRTHTLKPSLPTAKTKIKVEGGEAQPASEDAIKVARAQAKLKKSGPAALSNQELRELQERLNLERNVTQLTNSGGPGRIKRGREFIRNVTGIGNEVNNAVDTINRTEANAKKTRARFQ